MAKYFPSQGELKLNDSKQLESEIVNTASSPVITAGNSDLMNVVTYTSGTTSYIAIAPAGTDTASPLWQICRSRSLGGAVVVDWADGNTNFDNAAPDLTRVAALSYS